MVEIESIEPFSYFIPHAPEGIKNLLLCPRSLNRIVEADVQSMFNPSYEGRARFLCMVADSDNVVERPMKELVDAFW